MSLLGVRARSALQRWAGPLSILAILILAQPSIAQTTLYARMLGGINYQTGTTYTFVAADTTRITQFTNVSATSATLPNGNTVGFQAGTVVSTRAAGGTLTITCSGCTINGLGNLVLTIGQSADMYSDGLNYIANTGAGGSQGVLSGINTQTANYQLVATDANALVRMNVAGANTLTVPADATVNFAVGTAITIRQVGAGQTTISPAVGVTITTPSSLLLRVQYASVQIIKVAASTWDLLGDTQ